MSQCIEFPSSSRRVLASELGAFISGLGVARSAEVWNECRPTLEAALDRCIHFHTTRQVAAPRFAVLTDEQNAQITSAVVEAAQRAQMDCAAEYGALVWFLGLALFETAYLRADTGEADRQLVSAVAASSRASFSSGRHA